MELESVQFEMERSKDFAEKYNKSKLDFATINNIFAGIIL